MKRSHTIIYITGLGDRKPSLQRWAIKLWKIFGNVSPELFQNNWGDKRPFKEKRNRLLARIDELVAQGHRVSLVGTSAGASMALTAFALRKKDISGVVCVCGKINRPDTVSRAYYAANPAFEESMSQLNDRLRELSTDDKRKILSIHPLYDQTVPVTDTYIKGVKSRRIPTVFHVPSIALCLTVFSFVIIKFLKKQATINT